MKITLAYPTWDQIDQGCSRIVSEVHRRLESEIEPTLIVGLARGGLVPAVRISHLFRHTPMISINYSAKTGRGDNKQADNILIPGDNTKADHAPRGSHVLIVDDIADSGNTLKEVADSYLAHGCIVTTAVLYSKDGSVITPDIVWQQIPEDAPWIIFPWEI